MGVLPAIVWTGLHLSCVAIDMALLLLLLQLVGQWRPIGWVVAVNRATKDVVDRLNAAVGLRWQALTGIRLSQRGALAASVATLCLARLVLQGLGELMT